MDVELRHHIAERRDIDLVAAGVGLEHAAGMGDLAHQLRLLDHVEVGDLDSQVPARHQQQPGVGGVLDQQHPAERHVADRRGVFVDFGQNARDRTIASAYSVRPTSDARVSAPLRWDEVAGVEPEAFTIETMGPRIADVGDPMRV